MKRRNILNITSALILFILMLPGTNLRGAVGDSIQARQMAEDFFSTRLFDQAKPTALKSSMESDLILRYVSPDSAYSRVYLYENESGGYVMVMETGEQMLICAYSAEHSLRLENENSAIPAIIEIYEHVESIEEPSSLKSSQAV